MLHNLAGIPLRVKLLQVFPFVLTEENVGREWPPRAFARWRRYNIDYLLLLLLYERLLALVVFRREAGEGIAEGSAACPSATLASFLQNQFAEWGLYSVGRRLELLLRSIHNVVDV